MKARRGDLNSSDLTRYAIAIVFAKETQYAKVLRHFAINCSINKKFCSTVPAKDLFLAVTGTFNGHGQ